MNDMSPNSARSAIEANDSAQRTNGAIRAIAPQLRNFLIVLVAIALSVSLFIGLRTETTTASLSEIAKNSIPLDVALSNGKPTLMEFYANWCTSCQTIAPTLEELRVDYQDRLNFVMLNVDNSKWLPEMLKYRVDGIPHFVFLGADGEAIASAIGEIPRSVMAENLTALVAGNSLPYAQATGQVSRVKSPIQKASQSSDPRSHGTQVVN